MNSVGIVFGIVIPDWETTIKIVCAVYPKSVAKRLKEWEFVNGESKEDAINDMVCEIMDSNGVIDLNKELQSECIYPITSYQSAYKYGTQTCFWKFKSYSVNVDCFTINSPAEDEIKLFKQKTTEVFEELGLPKLEYGMYVVQSANG